MMHMHGTNIKVRPAHLPVWTRQCVKVLFLLACGNFFTLLRKGFLGCSTPRVTGPPLIVDVTQALISVATVGYWGIVQRLVENPTRSTCRQVRQLNPLKGSAFPTLDD